MSCKKLVLCNHLKFCFMELSVFVFFFPSSVVGWVCRCGTHRYGALTVYIYHKVLFSIRRNEILTHAITWLNLENMLNEISQSQKENTVWFHFCETSRTCKFTEAESRLELPRLGWKEAVMGTHCITVFLSRQMKRFHE